MVVMGSVLLLAGCASVPDAVNPVEWYKDVKGGTSQRKPQLIVMEWTALISRELVTESAAFGKLSRRQGFSLLERKAVAH